MPIACQLPSCRLFICPENDPFCRRKTFFSAQAKGKIIFHLFMLIIIRIGMENYYTSLCLNYPFSIPRKFLISQPTSSSSSTLMLQQSKESNYHFIMAQRHTKEHSDSSGKVDARKGNDEQYYYSSHLQQQGKQAKKNVS